ncbi:MAG TPA: flagellar hook-associated protein FlgL [Clostridia bacterium]|nr:flagellar hook-associated protein FlgL [Clostridia bacterium]
MRITNNMLVNNMINQIGTNLTRLDKYQNQMATGKKIQVPSDDPVVAARALKLRTDVAEVTQYQSNVKDAQSWLDITETTLGQIGDVIQRARELAVQATNGTNTSSDTQKTQAEIQQLKTQIAHLANTTYAGRYIFSGYQTDKPVMDSSGNYAISVNNNEGIKFEIGVGDDILVNVTAGDVFNGVAGTSAAAGAPPANGMISHFDNFINSLSTSNTTGVSQAITDMESDLQNVLRVRADIGARQNRLELTSNRLDDDVLNFTKLMSDNEDVDMASTIMNLTNEENVYKASLSGGARIIQPSLVDFLK